VNLIRLSLSLLRRDWRAGEWRVLLLALVLAVGSLSTVGLFADRIRQALQQQAQSLIGADLRITSTRPIAVDYRKLAQTHDLRVVESRTFPSMVSYQEQALLSEIQAVESGYPLRGDIEINDGVTHLAQSIPERGTVWVDARLLRRFAVPIGGEVGIGVQQFKVAARIVKDIDQSVGFASFAPRVLMNDADLASTELLQTGSRVSYRLMMAGEPAAVAAVRAELQAKLSGNEKLEDVRDARPEIRIALERAEHFLGLAALTAGILAGVAMALASRRFVLRHLDGCAVMRCLGAQQAQLLWLFLYQFIFLGVLAVLLGCVLGYAAQAMLVENLAAMRAANLPQPSVLPLFKASVSGFALLLGFAFLPLLQLRKVSPLRVLRRELGAPAGSVWLMYGLALLVLVVLFLWHAGSFQLGLVLLAGLLVGLMVFGGVAWLLLQGLGRYAIRFHSHWRQAFSNLARHGRSTAVQVVALSLGGMALLVLTLVRADLLEGWQDKLLPETQNRFVVSIQPDQVQAVTNFFTQQSLAKPQLMPMVRGRLVAINEQAISSDYYSAPRARSLVEREFNLSYMDKMPAWNELVQGNWWAADAAGTPEGGGQLSVEEGIAKTLGIKLGDTLTYDVAGSQFTGRVSNLRKVQWDSMKVNFYVIFSPGLLQNFPVSYLGSFYLPPDKVRVADALSQAFPNVLIIDTSAVLDRVRNIIEQIAQAVSAVFLFTLLCGLVVLYAALLAMQDERRSGAAILRTLGAESGYLRRLYLTEFAFLGLLSGLFAAGGAVLLGWVLAYFVLEIPYQPSAVIWLIGAGGGMAVVMLTGWLGTRDLMRLSPLAILGQ